MAVETACSASLVALNSAAKAVCTRECEVHLAAGVNLILLPSSSLGIAAAGMSSARGRSHTFDRRADGFARGEGCCAVTLLGNSPQSGLKLEGSAVRQDGRSASLTAPNGLAQQALLRAALADAGVGPAAVA